MKEYVFGIDVGGTTVKFGLFKNEELLEKWAIPTDTSNRGENLIKDISCSLKEKMNSHALSADDIKGAGIGIPGAVHDGYLEPCVNLGGFGGAGIEEAFKGECGFPFKLLNDANAAGLGEMRKGSAHGYENIYFITLGTGVGGCLILNKKLIAGAHGCCGEIGHMNMNAEEKRSFGLKKPGCLEMYASATGIVLNAEDLLKESDKPSALRDHGSFTCADVFDLAKKGDELSLETVELMARYLGRAMASIACVCNPDIFVIGGGVCAAGDFLIKKVEKYFKEYAFASSVNTKISLAVLGNDAGIWGGLEMAQSVF